jgi:hypothetical protein
MAQQSGQRTRVLQPRPTTAMAAAKVLGGGVLSSCGRRQASVRAPQWQQARSRACHDLADQDSWKVRGKARRRMATGRALNWHGACVCAAGAEQAPASGIWGKAVAHVVAGPNGSGWVNLYDPVGIRNEFGF